MVHTLPDYTSKWKLNRISANVDNAELAARLGSPVTLDRRGTVIWMDDFERAAAIKWAKSIDAGGTCTLSNTRAWMGDQSMKTVTNNVTGDSVMLGKEFALPTQHTMGAEIMYRILLGKPIVDIRIIGYDGGHYWTGEVRYNHNTQRLYYYDSGGNPVELIREDNNVTILEPWKLMKLVVDWDTKKYIRFMFCGTTYDLSTYDMESTGDLTMKHIEVYITNEAATDAAATVYFDNFIFTENEV